MVNKAALGVLAVVVIGVVGVGMLVGTVLDGGDSPAAPDDDDGGAEEPSGNATATTTATPGANVTQTAVPDDARTPIPDRRFETVAIARNLSRLINEERANAGVDPLVTEGTTARSLSVMASNHSADMASAGRVSHTIGNSTIERRYTNSDLADTCKYSRDGAANYRPDDPRYAERFEIVGGGVVGDYATVDGNRTFVENESQAARIAFEELRDNQVETPRGTPVMEIQQFDRVGVGVEITELNRVYVTVNFCS